MVKTQSNLVDLSRVQAGLPEGSHVLVAVSGGIDSTVCAHFLCKNRKRLSLSITLVYVHHGLRDAADSEAEFVQDLADQHAVSFFFERIDLEKGPNLQARARDLRYKALERIADENGYDRIVTAHNRDDQAETVLFRAIRGTGVTGLAGIHRQEGRIVRPLLDCSRIQIEQYAQKHGVTWCEDESNRSDKYTRNRIRHNVIPMLNEQLGMDVRPSLARLANVSRLEAQALDEVAAEDLARLMDQSNETELGIDIAGYGALGKGRRLGVLRKAWRQLTGSVARVQSVHLFSVDRLAFAANPSARVVLPDGLCAWRQYGQLKIGQKPEDAEVLTPIEMTGPGTYFFGDYQILWSEGAPEPAHFERDSLTVALDSDKLLAPLFVRTRLPGDRLRIFNGSGSRKLSDLMIDAKIPRNRRDRLLVITDSEAIVWVPGIGLDIRGVSSKKTGSAILLKVIEKIKES
jgi:tRNA(Ile)-lysidine synthase